jgi:hypothetical protein
MSRSGTRLSGGALLLRSKIGGISGDLGALPDRQGGACLAASGHVILGQQPPSRKARHARSARRVRGEFNEMPGLQLTIPQAARLLGIEPEACRTVIDQLVASDFLRKTPSGKIVRVGR